MKKCLHYLLRLNRPFYAAALVCFVGPMVWVSLSGFPEPVSPQFYLFANLLPAVVTLLPAIISISLCSNDLNRALSFGCRRHDYFRALLCYMTLNTLLFWGLAELYYRMPGLLGLGEPFGKIGLPSPAFPLLILTAYCTAGAIGNLWQDIPMLAVTLWGGLIGFFSTVLPVYEVMNKEGERFLRCAISGSTVLICVFLTVLSLTWIYNDIKTATVR